MINGAVVKGTEFQVNTSTDGDQFEQSATGLADGGYVVTWSSPTTGGVPEFIFGQLYKANGKPIGSEFKIGSSPENLRTEPAITALDDGGFIVSWMGYSGGSTSSLDVFGQRYDANANTVGAEFLINTHTPDIQGLPSIVELEGGGFVVTWTSLRQDDSLSSVFAQQFDQNSNPVGVEFPVNTFADGYQIYSEVIALSDGGYLIAWSSSTSEFETSGIFGQRYDASGVASGGEFAITTDPFAANNSLSITSLNDGGFVVTWDGDGDIHAQRFDITGAVSGDSFTFNSQSIDNYIEPAVTALSDGGYVVVWLSVLSDSPDAAVMGQRFDANGQPVGEEFQVNSEDFKIYLSGPNPRYLATVYATALENGGFVVTWSGNDINGDGLGVFAQQFKAKVEVFGTSDDDTLDGFATKDVLKGYEGNDVLNGYEGDDILRAGQGDDTLNGGAGDDRLIGKAGADTLNGEDGDDLLEGGDGNDLMFGGSGADTLIGGKGDDSLSGGDGDDVLKGSKGGDTLEGGAGDDMLYGGKGTDVFVFAGASGFDVIKDFKDGKDKLDLSALLSRTRPTRWAISLNVGRQPMMWLALNLTAPKSRLLVSIFQTSLQQILLSREFSPQNWPVDDWQTPLPTGWDHPQQPCSARIPVISAGHNCHQVQ